MGVSELRAPKIAILIPSHDYVPFNFAYDLSQLTMHTAATLPPGLHMGTWGATSTVIQKARQDLIDAALDTNPTHILWLDSDMRFPRETLIHLLSRDKEVIGVNAVKRAIPSDWTAYETLDPPKKLETYMDSTGLVEVEAMGLSVMLMKVTAFAGLPDPKQDPWFQFEYKANGDGWIGEDVRFCKLLREAGHTLYVDQDLSQHIQHIGTYEHNLTLMEAQRRVDADTAEERILVEA